MDKKSDGKGNGTVQSIVKSRTSPGQEAQEQLAHILNTATTTCYAEGIAHALKVLAPVIGRLPIESKKVLFEQLDALEKEVDELHKSTIAPTAIAAE